MDKKKKNDDEKDNEVNNDLNDLFGENDKKNKNNKKNNDKKKNNNDNKDDSFNFDKQNGDDKGKSTFRNIVIFILLLVVIISLPTVFKKTNEEISDSVVPYSYLVEQIKNEKVLKVEEKIPFVIATLKESTNISSTSKGSLKEKKIRARMISERLVEDISLINMIKEKNVPISSEEPDKSSYWWSMIVWWLPIILLIGLWIFMMNQMNKGPGGSSQIFNIGKSKTKSGSDINITFDDVAGVEEAKEELKEVVAFLKDHTKFLKVGAKIPKGVLLLGSPGTGKTLLAKAVAGEAGVPFFSISGSEFVEMFVGVGASRVRDLFNKAKKNSPCIIFIDEIDAVARQRGAGLGGGNDEREQTLNQLLVEMDGFGTDVNIIVIAATNRPDVLDKAILRPGRFDRQVVVDAPDKKGREAILRVHAKGKPWSEDVDFAVIARKTPGFVGADLANLINESAILAVRNGRDKIIMADVEEASEKVMAGPERKSKVISEEEKRNTAFHEVGHALIAYLLPGTDPVHKISIIPRGMALGYTMQLPTEDRLSSTKKEFYNEIKILLGGRAAEELIFNDVTTGASSDIQRATNIARTMITRYGMSDVIGPIRLGTDEEHPFLGRDFTRSANYSEETAKLIDGEISHMINQSYKDTKQLLIDNIELLKKISEILIEKETISGKEMEDIIKGSGMNLDKKV